MSVPKAAIRFNASSLLAVTLPTRRELPKGVKKPSLRLNTPVAVFSGVGHAVKPDGTPAQSYEDVLNYVDRIDPVLSAGIKGEGPEEGHGSVNTLPVDGRPIARNLATQFGITLTSAVLSDPTPPAVDEPAVEPSEQPPEEHNRMNGESEPELAGKGKRRR